MASATGSTSSLSTKHGGREGHCDGDFLFAWSPAVRACAWEAIETLRALASSGDELSAGDAELLEALEAARDDEPTSKGISYRLLRGAFRFQTKAAYFRDVIRGSSIVPPEPLPPPPPKNPELVARLEKLQKQVEDREYARMIKPITKKRDQWIESGELASYKSQISMGLNVRVTMLTLFALGFFLVSSRGYDFVLSAAAGAVGALIGMYIEAVLLVIRSWRADETLDRTGAVRRDPFATTADAVAASSSRPSRPAQHPGDLRLRK